ncbi:hypothetical protein LTR37_011295 [Vermiconidia calcicola]|uniref:Uncharacterized protein n=1 Tax=Vermiconidia calcicola TaxID=1690605 RepID=A0ACC3N2I8_9PEZI|nr:hypothetical protein LTR37_011295 [Vermiconidia calcicola]
MYTDEAQNSFRFLDLPPELRLRVYHFYFAPSSYPEPDLLLFRRHMPPSKLTTICRQVHAETQAICERARAEFLRDTVFSLDAPARRPPHWAEMSPEGEAIMDAVQGLQRAFQIHIRTVNFRLLDAQGRYNYHIRVVARVLSDGAIGWTVQVAPIDYHDTDTLERTHSYVLSALRDGPPASVSKHEPTSPGLDVARCLEAACDVI